MKGYFIAFLFFLILISCKQSAVKQSFSSSDSLVIHFKDEQAGIVIKTIQTTDSKAINRMIDFIDGKESENLNCGFDGKMFFFKDGQRIQEVDFKMNEDSCNHFAFMLDGKLVSKKMKAEAVDFFNALEQGLPFY